MIAIGMGWPAAAADFREQQDVPFPLLVDHTKQTYRAVKMKRGTLWQVAGPPVWLRSIKSFVGGHGMTPKPKQDPLQMGGVVVVEAGGRILYQHISETSSDNPPTDDVVAAIP